MCGCNVYALDSLLYTDVMSGNNPDACVWVICSMHDPVVYRCHVR